MTKPTKKTGRRKPPPKKQQNTSVNAIIRARVKELVMEFRLQNFTIRDIIPAINEMMGPGGDKETPGFKPIKSPHLLYDLLREAIAEAVDPLKKEELLNLHIAQHNQILTAMLAPAIQGSTQHATIAMAVMARLEKLLKLTDSESGEPGGTTIQQIFLNGALARC